MGTLRRTRSGTWTMSGRAWHRAAPRVRARHRVTSGSGPDSHSPCRETVCRCGKVYGPRDCVGVSAGT